MKEKWGIFTIAFYLAAGCSNGNPSGDDMGRGGDLALGGDMASGDMASGGPSGGALELLAGQPGGAGYADRPGKDARFFWNQPLMAVDGVGNLNGDYESAYMRWLATTCRNWDHDYSTYSAEPHAPAGRSAA